MNIATPHPLRGSDLDEAERIHQQMELDLALSRAKAWCLKAEDFFKRLHLAGVREFRYEVVHCIRFTIIDENNKCVEVTPREGGVAMSSRIHSLRLFAQELEGLLKDYCIRRDAWPKSLPGRFADNTPMDTQESAKVMGRLLLGFRAYDKWMSEREALALYLSTPMAAQSDRKPRL